MTKRSSQAGMTLIEVMIAVALFAMLSVGIMMALRVGMNALERSNDRLMTNRRAAYSSRILQSELNDFMPELALFKPPQSSLTSMPFFQGEPSAMRFVSSYALQSASRGKPQILEFHVIPGEETTGGVRLVVNETPYTGPASAGVFCVGYQIDPSTNRRVPLFRPIQTGANSFVIADKLASCHFVFQAPGIALQPPYWTDHWVLPSWPLAIRMEMQPLHPDATRLQPMTVTSAVHVNRSMEIDYADN